MFVIKLLSASFDSANENCFVIYYKFCLGRQGVFESFPQSIQLSNVIKTKDL